MASIERECGTLELSSVRRNDISMSTVVFVSAVYNKPLDDRSTIFQALGQLIRENVSLNINVFNHKSEKPVFRILNQVDLEKVVVYQPELDLEAFTDQQFEPSNKFSYDIEEVLWKFHVIGKDLRTGVFVFDHSAFDGASGMLLHKKLVSALNSQESTSTEEASASSIVQGGHTKLNPSLEYYGQTKPSSWYALKKVAQTLKHRFIKPTQVWNGPGQERPPKNQSVYIKCDPEKTSKLAQVAKSKKISMQSLLYTAVMQVLAEECPDKTLSLGFGCPVDARRFINSEDQEIGCLVYYHVHTLKDYESDLSAGRPNFVEKWARDFHRNLKQALAQPKEIAWLVGVIGGVDIMGLFNFEVRGVAKCTVEVSNLGVVKFEEGEYQVSEIALGQPATGVGAPLIVSAATAAGGCMTLQISYTPDDDNKARCVEFRERLTGVLDSLIE